MCSENLLSAKGAVDADFVQGPLENGEFLIIEVSDEQLRDPAQVDRRLAHAGDAGVGQRNHDATCVCVGFDSTNEAFLNQPGDAPGYARS